MDAKTNGALVELVEKWREESRDPCRSTSSRIAKRACAVELAALLAALTTDQDAHVVGCRSCAAALTGLCATCCAQLDTAIAPESAP